MTQTRLAAPPESTGDRTRVTVAGAAVLALTAACTIWRADDRSEIVIVLAVLVPTVVVVYGVVLPRALRRPGAPQTAMVLAALAGILLLPAFWSGQPFVLGIAAAWVGWRGRRAVAGPRRCAAAVVIGLLAAVGYVVIYLADWLLPS